MFVVGIEIKQFNTNNYCMKNLLQLFTHKLDNSICVPLRPGRSRVIRLEVIYICEKLE